MKIVEPRRKRSIIQHDTLARKHIETKTVLLQALGNAGKTRSLRHIRSYMEPNMGVTAWRRAAIHSLRHFTCNEVAQKRPAKYIFNKLCFLIGAMGFV